MIGYGTMKNEWFVSTNIVGGKLVYQVVRFKNKEHVDHSGVREVFGPVMTNKERAERMADMLNKEEA